MDQDHLPSTLDNGRYVVEKVLGAGGTATVLLAEDTRIGVRRAIKILHPQYAKSAESRRRFLNEAHAQAGLAHPNVLMVHDAVEDGETTFLVMELAEQGTLGDRVLNEGVMTPQDVASVGITIGGALAVAHKAGVIHRDIKPANILVDRHGVLKLADFGIARVDGERFHLTRTGSVMGTWAYMPPEQRSDSASVDARSDIYAFGVTLYALLKGREASDLHNKESWARAFDGVPPGMARVIQAATRLYPEDRYDTMELLVEDLQQWLRTATGDERLATVPHLAPAVSMTNTSGPGELSRGGPVRHTLVPDPTFSFDGEDDSDPLAPLAVGRDGAAAGPQTGDGAAAPGDGAEEQADAAAPTMYTPSPAPNRLANVLMGITAAASVVAVAALLFVLFVGRPDPVQSPAGGPTDAGPLPPPAAPAGAAAGAPGSAADGGAAAPGTETPAPADPAATGTPSATGTGAPAPGDDGAAPAPTEGTRRQAEAAPASRSSGGSSGGRSKRRVIKVIPSGSGTSTGGAAPAPSSDGPTMGRMRVRTVPSGATVRLRGRVLSPKAGAYELPVGNQTVELTSPSGETTRMAVMVKAGSTVDLCYSFDTNSACGGKP